MTCKSSGKKVTRQRFGGHSARRGGAMSLAGAKFPWEFIRIWGRWESDCVRRYCEDAFAQATSGDIGCAMVQTETSLSKAWKAAWDSNLNRAANKGRDTGAGLNVRTGVSEDSYDSE